LLAITAQAAAKDSSLLIDQQRPSAVRAAAGKGLTAPSAATPASIVQEFLRARGASAAAVAALRQTDSRTTPNGVTHIRMEQQAGGLTVYGSAVKASLNARGELIYVSEKLAPAGVPRPAGIGEAKALAAVLQHLHPNAQVAPTAGARSGNTLTFHGGAFFHRDAQVTRVAVPMNDGALATGYLVETWTRKGNLLHHTLVGGDGSVLSVEKRTANDAYRVFIEDPLKGAQTVVSGPAPGGVASPEGWLASVAQTDVKITGNNAHSYLDTNDNNQPDKGGTSVSDGNFLTGVDLTESPTTIRNQAVAVQNLFYLVNVVHDKLYAKGFTEVAGNFQENNFGRGCKDSDSVNAEAQDGEGTDNANFATPLDGKNPRMQMFLFTGLGTTHEVRVNPLGPSYAAVPAEWSTFTTTGLTGNIVLVNDGVATGTTSDACEPIGQNLRGLIALADRGTCTFAVKAQNVQRAGAAGLIVANNSPAAPVVMGSSGVNLRVPAMMISQADGAALRALANPSATMYKLAVQPLQIDASLDADIVFHEYGHGLTWRMINGMSGPLAGAIGEGASDTLAMFINGDDRIGEYATSNPTGIRRAPYAGYPLTYKDVTGQGVHNDGEIYAAAMWRLMELFGNDKETLFGYWVDGMHYTPSGPAYEDMRDGMLQAIANSTGSASHCGLVWQAFAERGIGRNAQGTVNADGTVSIQESFENLGNTCSTQ
jgi:hypothetical protein